MIKKEDWAILEGGNMTSYKVRLNYTSMGGMTKKRLKGYLRSLRDKYYADKDISDPEEVQKLKDCIDYGFNILNNMK